jgi:hypothetical protein
MDGGQINGCGSTVFVAEASRGRERMGCARRTRIQLR